MTSSEAPMVQVENQLIRFTPATPFDPEKAVQELGATRSGDYVIHALQRPRATILIDKDGRIVVHGTIQPQAARAAAREFLLRIGESDEGLTSEKGPVIASFDLGRKLEIERKFKRGFKIKWEIERKFKRGFKRKWEIERKFKRGCKRKLEIAFKRYVPIFFLNGDWLNKKVCTIVYKVF